MNVKVIPHIWGLKLHEIKTAVVAHVENIARDVRVLAEGFVNIPFGAYGGNTARNVQSRLNRADAVCQSFDRVGWCFSRTAKSHSTAKLNKYVAFVKVYQFGNTNCGGCLL